MPRADAQRNRARLLQVAEEVFAERGPAVATEEIARAAGVGIGTLFRHFPTKEALLQEVYLTRLRRLADDAAASPTLAGWIRRAVEQSRVKNAFADALTEAGLDPRGVAGDVHRDLLAAIDTMLRRDQSAGAVRADLRVPDVIALLAGASRAVEVSPDSQSRVLDVLFTGLKP
ncbi:AcrR family transcriptional regulator [Actinoplanes octamycinicus]|uniref:AcrR family transcriptional regulator n=1 Tax=Actinoplanes octamycinicus TaxID=135948 RepID=A0A7W7MBU5_9ACTN|nr:helix-turn-helix domain-containing protein [Actinoplanes octamycinicus]MBB4744453.1 AcrR family transcriptional regulator [Actinoplanes octamycinicus]GIE61630.1 TetR family transcriptional regulator [Actinoplanes octamycinicus]